MQNLESKLEGIKFYYEKLVEDIYMNREQYSNAFKEMRCEQMLQDGAMLAADLTDIQDDPDPTIQEIVKIFGRMFIIVVGAGWNGYDCQESFYELWYNQIIKTGLDRKFAQLVGLDDSLFEDYEYTIKQLKKGNWCFYGSMEEDDNDDEDDDEEYGDGEILFMGQVEDD